MKNVTIFLCLTVAICSLFSPTVATTQMLNPYAPMNAVAAEPLTPYNLWDIPECSRTSYTPCPAPVPFSTQLPDLPPVSAPFPGPFGIPVPVP